MLSYVVKYSVLAFVTLQNLRYQDQIRLELEIDEDIMELLMLKITLQPIVENAIAHGLLRSPSKSGTIRMAGERRRDVVVFSVSDDGAGMRPETVARILDADTSDEFHGYGIKNIHERIQLQYGASYGLSYASVLGEGTTVTITLPAVARRLP